MRSRHLYAAIPAAALALALAGVVGVASADGPGTPATRTITVTGDASAAVSCSKSGASDAEKVYRAALATALDEAKDKAGFIAGRVGAALGPVQAVNENSSAGDPCAGVIAVDTPMPIEGPDAPATSPPSVGTGISGIGIRLGSPGQTEPAPIDGGSVSVAAPDIAPVPQPKPQVWASVTVTYVIS